MGGVETACMGQLLTCGLDWQATFIDWACLRICNTIGAEFMPYLLFVMPPLLYKARLKPDLAILDTDDPAAGVCCSTE